MFIPIQAFQKNMMCLDSSDPLLNSIQGALSAWETHVNVDKASEVDNIQKWNKQKWTVNITLTEVPKQ